MAVARITESINLDNTGRFVIVFGNFIQEVFISNDLELCSKEQILHKFLKGQNFKRVVFFDSRHRIHCYDQETQRLCNNNVYPDNAVDNQPHDSQTNSSSRVNGRPLGGGKRKIFKESIRNSSYSEQSTVSKLTTRGFYKIPCSSNDSLIADELDSLLRNDNIKTALLIKFSELGMDSKSYSNFLNTINGWGSISVRNENKCFFIFNSPTDESLNASIRSIPLIQSILNTHKREGTGMQSMLFLSYPKMDEIKRIVQYYRLKNDLSVSWKDLNVVTNWLEKDVQNLLHWQKQFSRIESIDKKSIKNILSENASTDDRSGNERLNELIGLSGVKQEIEERIAVLRLGRHNPSYADDNRLHLTFEGNPGTGKTTVARIIASIYQEEGILERGHLVEADRGSLVAQYVGHTAPKTAELCKRAMGGVLFIDEAYTLKQNDNDTFGQEAIDTLIKYMEDFKNDFCVIMAGYPDDMEKLLTANPGIKSRLGKRIRFEDFNPEELFQIFKLNQRKKQLVVSKSYEQSLKQILSNLYVQRDKEFGNAREVEKIIQGSISKYAIRCSKQRLNTSTSEIVKKDIPEKYRILDIEDDIKGALKAATEELNNMVGLDSVKSLIQDLVQSIDADNKRKALLKNLKEKNYNLHLTFQGNPGTGKTTVARLLGKIFRILKVISKGHVVETQRADLVAGYTGQTGPKVKAKVAEAMDGVLFIDEAYALSKNKEDTFGQEAVETLLKEMEDNRDRLVVIAAGYPEDMKHFIQQNPGLRSRFTSHIIFEDYTIDELAEIFKRIAKSDGFILSSGVDELVKQALTTIKSRIEKKEFGNAREARKLYDKVLLRFNKRFNKIKNATEEDACTIIIDDIPEEYLERVKSELPSEPSIQRSTKASSNAFVKERVEIQLHEQKQEKKLTKQEINDHVGQCTGIINCDKGIGTGFCISPDGYFLTCYHVVKESSKFTFRLNNSSVSYQAYLCAYDDESDLALLKIYNYENVNFSYISIVKDKYNLSIGSEIAIQGFPEGEKHSTSVHYSEGVIMNVDTKNQIKNAFSIEVTAKQGNSGSPVYLKDTGEVIGVLFGKPHGFDSILCTSQVSIHQLVRFIFTDDIKKEERRKQQPIPSKNEKKKTDRKKHTNTTQRHSYIDKVNFRAKKLKTIPEDLFELDYDKIYIDSNIWFFSAKKQFKGALFQSLITLAAACKVLSNKIVVTSTVYNELVSIKDNKEDSRSRDAAITISTISQLAESDLLEYDGILGSAPEEVNYADPPFIEKSVKALDKENSIMVISGDNDVRQRTRNLLKDKSMRLNLKSKYKVLTPSELISFSMDLSEKLRS